MLPGPLSPPAHNPILPPACWVSCCMLHQPRHGYYSAAWALSPAHTQALCLSLSLSLSLSPLFMPFGSACPHALRMYFPLPKWNSRNKREPFDEQASTLGDFHRAVQESGHPPCALHTSRGSRGLPEGGKVESALMLPQSPHGGRPAGKRAHSCIPAATPSSSARTPYSLSVVWMQLQLPAWGRPRPVLHSPAEQPRSLGFSALVFTT